MAAVSLFKWLVCSTVMATILVIIVLMIKYMFKNKLGAKWHYLIWFFVVLKLLIPFGPESRLSIYNMFNLTNHNITQKSYTVMDTLSTATNSIALSTPIPDSLAHDYSKSTPSSNHDKIVYLSIFGLAIWFLGMITATTIFYLKSQKLLHGIHIGGTIEDECIQNLLQECKMKLGIRRNITIKTVSNLNTPCLVGVVRPVLLIPEYLVHSENLWVIKYSIYHELAHVVRMDIPVNVLLTLLSITHWFNPVIWYAFHKLRQDSELACDDLVLSKLKSQEHKRYGYALLHFLERFSKNIELSTVACFLSNKSNIKNRIQNIASYKKNSFKVDILKSLGFTALFLIVFTNAVEKLI